jgi:flagellar M-ring protein FliF
VEKWWNTIAPAARIGLAAGLLALLAALAGAAWWVLRAEPAVLFSELRPQDASLMASELEKLKIPYTVADQGATLLVDRSQVHAARLKLMGRELPLHGSVGFELFNTTEFGMTEFAQKINYQRALQGELTRTILSFPEIRDARVHLALPEQGLFRQNTTRPKAAITLTLRPGQALRREQVSGIQRLVAAAVPGLLAQEVTLVDQQGVALTPPAESEPEAGANSLRLELKRELEAYLARKAGAVLDQAFGAGQALASVDVTLNLDQVKVTTEEVIAAPEGRSGQPAGVLVRERESARDGAVPEASGADARTGRGSSMQRDVEYQAGRRVEQVVSQPGAIRRLQVVAVVRQALPEGEEARLRHLVAAAVGAATERGDTVVVQALQPVAAVPVAATPPAVAAAAVPSPAQDKAPWPASIALVLVLPAVVCGLLWRHARRARRARLSERERQAALQQVRAWMIEATPTTVGGAGAPIGSAE